ncbi:hypothetical protein J437_LFUL007245 [Ladona fulva]|uniref:Uncharacterized protein n=1 Tax=Ladona fulva TaxID=123851 RepID=A0A8K0JX43_LADFU|nr:hypothetical protein J437_LFUL007245 [Ladona fulva]
MSTRGQVGGGGAGGAVRMGLSLAVDNVGVVGSSSLAGDENGSRTNTGSGGEDISSSSTGAPTPSPGHPSPDSSQPPPLESIIHIYTVEEGRNDGTGVESEGNGGESVTAKEKPQRSSSNPNLQA